MTDTPFLRIEPVAPPGAARFTHAENFRYRFLLRKGRPLGDRYPTDTAYRMNRDFPDDIALEDAAFNLDRQLVVSERLRAFLEERGGPDLEFLPVTLINHKGRAEKASYAIVNLLRHVDAIDQEATAFEWNELDETSMSEVSNLTVDPSRIPDDAVLFRLQHLTNVMGVRRDLAEAIEAEGFTGLDFTDFADYRG